MQTIISLFKGFLIAIVIWCPVNYFWLTPKLKKLRKLIRKKCLDNAEKEFGFRPKESDIWKDNL